MSSVDPFDRLESLVFPGGYGFVALPGWSSIVFTGTDRHAFLHNFCTNDVRKLLAGENCEAFITNVKGKVIGHGLITCRDSELVFVTVPQQGSALVAHFDRYIIRDDVQVRDTTAERSYILLTHTGTIVALAPTLALGQSWLRFGVNASGRLRDLPVRWIGWDLLGRAVVCGLIEVATLDIPKAREALIESGMTPFGEAAFHTRRIEAGVPLFGIDFDEQNFPQEVGRDHEAVSFTKGCYLGQETVARIDALGHVNQRLVGVRFFRSGIPAPGTELSHSGKTVGHTTSAAYSPRLSAPLGLAMVRREANAAGTRLESHVGSCEVVTLPVGD
jgi:folate-binding protein YgfZ